MKHTKSVASERRRRKLFTIVWSLLLAAVTITLIYWEMTAVLYILATLGVTALLVMVAMSDLRPAGKSLEDSTRVNDSAAIGNGITSTFGAKQS
jgi:membrane protein YdbS with pleckstrin-like domain